jgi:hypothetical protein
LFLAISMMISATIIMALGLGRRAAPAAALAELLEESEAVIEPA